MRELRIDQRLPAHRGTGVPARRAGDAGRARAAVAMRCRRSLAVADLGVAELGVLAVVTVVVREAAVPSSPRSWGSATCSRWADRNR
jgi:hypothetical protein